MTSVKVVVIGVAGLLGKVFSRRLATLQELHVTPEEALPISQVVLFGLNVSSLQEDPLLCDRPGWAFQQGDLTDRQVLRALVAPSSAAQRVVVFLFAAILSGAAENKFELGLEVNLCAPLALLKELKAVGERFGRPPTLVYTSSDYVACFNEANRATPFSEEGFRLSPTSYGVQKACMELLICDFARRGFVDGRVGRVSAMIGRPGFSNSVSSAFSMIFTQPLIGQDYEVPLPMDASLPCSSIENNVECLLQLAGKVSGEALGHNRVVQLPARSFTLAQIASAAKAAAQRHGIALGRTTLSDPSTAGTTFKLINVVPHVDCGRAERLGLPGRVELNEIIENFIQREGLNKAKLETGSS